MIAGARGSVVSSGLVVTHILLVLVSSLVVWTVLRMEQQSKDASRQRHASTDTFPTSICSPLD